MAIWTQAAHDAALLELEMHAQFMELWVKELIGLDEDTLIKQYESDPLFKLEHHPDCKPDTPKQAYLHNHLTDVEWEMMTYGDKCQAAKRLSTKLGKVVVF